MNILDRINKMESKISSKPTTQELVEEYSRVLREKGGNNHNVYKSLVKKYNLSQPEADKFADELDQVI